MHNMPKRTNVSLLGIKIWGNLEKNIHVAPRFYIGLSKYRTEEWPRCCHDTDVLTCLGVLASKHLGAKTEVDVELYLNKGFEITIDYFCTDWWKHHPDDRRNMNKNGRSGSLRWVKVFAPGMLFGLLLEQWESLEKVCDWVEAKCRPEFQGDEIEPELLNIHKSVAAALRTTPFKGLDKVEQEIFKCRTKRPKLLLQALIDARNGDQTSFNESFLKALENQYEQYPRDERLLARECVSIHHNVVGLTAKRLGMQWPELPPHLSAMLMTRESLGLKPIKKKK
jgi:hypothetical protein